MRGSRLYTSRPSFLSAIPSHGHLDMRELDGRLTIGVTGFEKTLAVEAGQAVGLADKLGVRFSPEAITYPSKNGSPNHHRRERRNPPTLSSAHRRRRHVNPEIVQTVLGTFSPSPATSKCPIAILKNYCERSGTWHHYPGL